MEKVTNRKQLKIITEDRKGILAEISGAVAEKGINIEHICAYSCNGKATFYLLTNDNNKARDALENNGYEIEETEVIILQMWNRPGFLSAVAAKFRQNGINLQYIYGTSSMGGEKMTMVFSSEDNSAASDVFDLMVMEEADKTI